MSMSPSVLCHPSRESCLEDIQLPSASEVACSRSWRSSGIWAFGCDVFARALLASSLAVARASEALYAVFKRASVASQLLRFSILASVHLASVTKASCSRARRCSDIGASGGGTATGVSAVVAAAVVAMGVSAGWGGSS